jgi:hypothetical protein
VGQPVEVRVFSTAPSQACASRRRRCTASVRPANAESAKASWLGFFYLTTVRFAHASDGAAQGPGAQSRVFQSNLISRDTGFCTSRRRRCTTNGRDASAESAGRVGSDCLISPAVPRFAHASDGADFCPEARSHFWVPVPERRMPSDLAQEFKQTSLKFSKSDPPAIGLP